MLYFHLSFSSVSQSLHLFIHFSVTPHSLLPSMPKFLTYLHLGGVDLQDLHARRLRRVWQLHLKRSRGKGIVMREDSDNGEY